jgi:hypothetical protein
VDGALSAPAVLEACDIGILPMAGKDGVVRGQTRFNVNGYDLNRGFVRDYDFGPHNAPENRALMEWLTARQRRHALPVLAVDLHDDDSGNLHVGHKAPNERYDRHMALLDQMMRKHTYYTEGMAKGLDTSTFGAGLLNILDMDSVVYELNSNWLAATQSVPGSRTWTEFGAQFARMLVEYLAAVAAG